MAYHKFSGASVTEGGYRPKNGTEAHQERKRINKPLATRTGNSPDVCHDDKVVLSRTFSGNPVRYAVRRMGTSPSAFVLIDVTIE
jgi:hypothetical protein